MIKLIKRGCYYMGGLLVRESQAFQTSEQKLAAQRGTMAYQILKTHDKGDEQNMRAACANSRFRIRSRTATILCARSAAPSMKTIMCSAFRRRKNTAQISCLRTWQSFINICARWRRKSAA